MAEVLRTQGLQSLNDDLFISFRLFDPAALYMPSILLQLYAGELPVVPPWPIMYLRWRVELVPP